MTERDNAISCLFTPAVTFCSSTMSRLIFLLTDTLFCEGAVSGLDGKRLMTASYLSRQQLIRCDRSVQVYTFYHISDAKTQKAALTTVNIRQHSLCTDT